MGKKDSGYFIDAGRVESQIYEPDEEVKKEFEQAQMLVPTVEQLDGDMLLNNQLHAHHHQALPFDDGEEAVGGFITTPDDDSVDEMGEAIGLVYEDNEPLHTPDKVAARDRNRWELDPASAEDYQRRNNHQDE